MRKAASSTAPIVFTVRAVGALALAFSTFALLPGCASPPPAPRGPEWIRQPTRQVDNGYIVYVGRGEASTPDRAQLVAEGVALEDLANECSLIPKGTRVEDRYAEMTKTGHVSFVKVALELQECDHAVKTNDPEEIKKIANVGFTEFMKRYQDYAETGDVPPASESAEIQPPVEIASAPEQGRQNERVHFYLTRQYIAYQKEIVVLSPPQAYQAGSVESKKFMTAVQPASDRVQGLMQKDPGLRTQPVAWSRLPDRPHFQRPPALSVPSLRTSTLKSPFSSAPPRAAAHAENPAPPAKKARRRRGRRR